MTLRGLSQLVGTSINVFNVFDSRPQIEMVIEYELFLGVPNRDDVEDIGNYLRIDGTSIFSFSRRRQSRGIF